MREIKFRAWDKNDKKWVETNTLVEWITRWRNVTYIRSLEFVQFTGLKDKNGEGDL
jgi:hypothetical protein